MKSKILVVLEDDSFEYADFYFNEDKIDGWFISRDNLEDESVNVLYGYQTLTLKRSPQLIDYLLTKYPV